MKPTALAALLFAAGTVPSPAQDRTPPTPPPPPPAPVPAGPFGPGHGSGEGGPALNAAAKLLIRHQDGQDGKADRIEVIEVDGPPGLPRVHQIQSLLAGGRRIESKTFLGVSTSPVPPEYARHLPVAPYTGLLLETVEDNSPAASAGLQAHDILTKFDDQILVNPEQLAVLVAGREPESEVKLTFLRKGAVQEATVTLGRRDSAGSADVSPLMIPPVLPGDVARALEAKVRRLEIPLHKEAEHQARGAIRTAERALKEAERAAREAGGKAKAPDESRETLRNLLKEALNALENEQP